MGKEYLSFTMALILQALDNGYRYGFDVMAITGLASGTVYPALRRLENAGLVFSKWERPGIARQEQRGGRVVLRPDKVFVRSTQEPRPPSPPGRAGE